MRVTLKFGKLFGTDIELESQGYTVQKYGIVSAIICLLSNYYLHIYRLFFLVFHQYFQHGHFIPILIVGVEKRGAY